MELRHLRYLVAVAEELSFRRAANRLHVSHPALSQQIHDLENELALKLFERNSRGVELTEVGRVFLIGARKVLAAAEQAVTQAQETAKGVRGRLVIGSVSPLTSSFLPNALARFREQRPLVEVTVSHMNNRVQVEAVLDGSIMLGIGYFGSAADEDAGATFYAAATSFSGRDCLLQTPPVSKRCGTKAWRPSSRQILIF